MHQSEIFAISPLFSATAAAFFAFVAATAAFTVFVLMTTAAALTFSVSVTTAASFAFSVLVTATAASVATATVSVAMAFARREELTVKAFAQLLLGRIPDRDDFSLEVHAHACHRWVEIHSDLLFLDFHHHTPADLA